MAREPIRKRSLSDSRSNLADYGQAVREFSPHVHPLNYAVSGHELALAVAGRIRLADADAEPLVAEPCAGGARSAKPA
jgi:hypothetical protein